MRRSCNLLSRPEMEGGKTPTTPTVSSIIAGVQCQEAVKLLHGMETIAGRGWTFSGLTADSYIVEYQAKAECYSHDILDEVIPLDGRAANITPADVLRLARERLGAGATIELAREVLHKLVCPKCGGEQEAFVSLGRAKDDLAACPNCPGVRREAVTFFKIRGDEPFVSRPLAKIGVPPFDVLIARGGGRSIGFELTGDAASILGELWQGDRGLEFI
jgi:adenylyltransferase/sulfurtransferase